MASTNGSSVLFETSNGKLANGGHANGQVDSLSFNDTNNNHATMNGNGQLNGKVVPQNGARGPYKLDDRTWSRAYCVLGAQWGDEGKGKIVDLLASEMDVVCRCAVS